MTPSPPPEQTVLVWVLTTVGVARSGPALVRKTDIPTVEDKDKDEKSFLKVLRRLSNMPFSFDIAA